MVETLLIKNYPKKHRLNFFETQLSNSKKKNDLKAEIYQKIANRQ